MYDLPGVDAILEPIAARSCLQGASIDERESDESADHRQRHEQDAQQRRVPTSTTVPSELHAVRALFRFAC
jgi:hypothetical protein